MPLNVHDLKPGDLALVAHTDKIFTNNCWTIELEKQFEQNMLLVTGIRFENRYYSIRKHIPHGTLVIVVSKHKMITPERKLVKMPESEFDSNGFYRIVWEDQIVFVRQTLLINPYINNQEP